MPRKDQPIRPDTSSDSAVKLHPILGVRPGVYLTVFYGVVLLLILFFFLFFPALKNRGSYVFFEVQPGKASIIVDGDFAGTAPGTVFLKHGKRHVEITKAFYATHAFDVEITGRIFATLLVPSRLEIFIRLSSIDPIGLIEHSLNDFTDNPFIPQILVDAAMSLSSLGVEVNKAEIQEKLYDFVFNCMYYINPLLDSSIASTSSENQMAGILKSSFLTASNGSFLTVQSMTDLMKKIVQVNEKYPNMPGLVLLALSREKAKKLSDLDWTTRLFSQYRNALLSFYQVSSISQGQGVGSRPAVSIGGIAFRSIPQGILVMGRDDNLETLGKSIDLLLPHPVRIRPYYLSETEVTNLQYQAFIDAVPQWRPSNRNALAALNLVTEEYLSEWVDDRFPAGHPDYPVTDVSYEASRAFCEWFSLKARTVLSGYSARLPTEAEWEWAARGGLRGMPYPLGEKPGNAVFFFKGITGPSKSGASSPNAYGIRDMMGNVWEWCKDSYGPSDYLLTSLDPDANSSGKTHHPVSSDKVVRGGGWNSQKESIKVYTRGSQRSEWCTPFLGFRIALSAGEG